MSDEQFRNEIIFSHISMSEMQIDQCLFCGMTAYSKPELNYEFDKAQHIKCKPKRKRKKEEGNE
jgi:hypothetical protein